MMITLTEHVDGSKLHVNPDHIVGLKEFESGCTRMLLVTGAADTVKETVDQIAQRVAAAAELDNGFSGLLDELVSGESSSASSAGHHWTMTWYGSEPSRGSNVFEVGNSQFSKGDLIANLGTDHHLRVVDLVNRHNEIVDELLGRIQQLEAAAQPTSPKPGSEMIMDIYVAGRVQRPDGMIALTIDGTHKQLAHLRVGDWIDLRKGEPDPTDQEFREVVETAERNVEERALAALNARSGGRA